MRQTSNHDPQTIVGGTPVKTTKIPRGYSKPRSDLQVHRRCPSLQYFVLVLETPHGGMSYGTTSFGDCPLTGP